MEEAEVENGKRGGGGGGDEEEKVCKEWKEEERDDGEDSDEEEEDSEEEVVYEHPPSQDTKHLFQWYYDRDVLPPGCVDYDTFTESGKWMLFYPVAEMDEKWEMVKNLFDAGELWGVRGMKISTAAHNPRSSDDSMAVIIMYCGPWTDEQLMRKTGKNLVEKTKYENKYGFMRYKTDNQTRGGTRATGQKLNHIYSMEVPRPLDCDGATPELPELSPSKDTTEFWHWHFPKLSPLCCPGEYDYSKSGRWLLTYSLSDVDEKWQIMKDLFDSNELDGVRGMKVTTAASSQEHGFRSLIIFVYCGPWDDEEHVMRVGKNLAEKTEYWDKSGIMRYKTDIVGKWVKGVGQMPKYNYTLQVPRSSKGANPSLHETEFPPSEDTEKYWQYHPESLDSSCDYDSSTGGKWMMFYPMSEIDSKWKQMKDLFDAGKLQGVRQLQVSTAKGSARNRDANSGVINVYCGPSDDAELMLQIGQRVAEMAKYVDKSGIMRYKGDTRVAGGATNWRSPSYWLQVPRPWMGASAREREECPPSRDRKNTWQWHPKSLDDSSGYDPATGGKWMLFYPMFEIDEKWQLIKDLFDAGELHGVGEIKVSTAKGNYGKRDKDNGVINVYCGPYYEEELMMRIGRNLAKKMEYENRYRILLYKTDEPVRQGRGMDRRKNHLYEISVPWRRDDMR